MVYFRHGEVETIPQFQLKYLHTRSENFLLQDEIGQTNNLTGKYIMEMSKLEHLQCYMTNFELDYINF